jgi:hypothetical protein
MAVKKVKLIVINAEYDENSNNIIENELSLIHSFIKNQKNKNYFKLIFKDFKNDK